MKHSRSNAGFSLMELLIAAVLIPIIAFAVFSNFSSATRLWKKINQSDWQEDIQIFSEKTDPVFMNALKYTPIPFESEDGELSFASFIRTDPKLGGDHGIGEVVYSYDEAHGVLLKSERNLSELFREAKPVKRPVLTHVRSCRIEFYGPTQLSQGFEWKDEWKDAKGNLPIATRFSLEVDDGGEFHEIALVFLIPTGGA